MEIGKDFIWLGHASFFLKHSGKNIYIDPFMLPADSPKADAIFITHAHPDHYSPADIDKIIKPETQILCSKGCDGIEKYPNVTIIKPGESKEALGVKLDAIRAYNVKQERLNIHPKSNDWLGYIMEIDGKKIYHAGDTDFIDEMRQLKGLHAALLPMGGTYTMDVDEMIEAAKVIGTEHVIPIHYRRLLGHGAPAAEEKLKKSINNAMIMEEKTEFP